MKAAKATKLKDLEVDRIDGVRDPATGMKFLLFKSADAAQRVVRKTGGLFGDVVFGVKKSVREYLPGQDGVKETGASSVAAALESWAGKTEDGTRTPGAPATSGFDREGARHGAVKVGPNYGISDPWLRGDLHADPGFSAGEGSDIPEAANFRATEPGALNLGPSMQFSKSALLWAYADAVRAGEAELAKAIKSKLEKHGVDVKKSVDNVEWVYGPAKWSKR
jgi:hypothetical protein